MESMISIQSAPNIGLGESGTFRRMATNLGSTIPEDSIIPSTSDIQAGAQVSSGLPTDEMPSTKGNDAVDADRSKQADALAGRYQRLKLGLSSDLNDDDRVPNTVVDRLSSGYSPNRNSDIVITDDTILVQTSANDDVTLRRIGNVETESSSVVEKQRPDLTKRWSSTCLDEQTRKDCSLSSENKADSGTGSLESRRCLSECSLNGFSESTLSRRKSLHREANSSSVGNKLDDGSSVMSAGSDGKRGIM